MAYIGKQPVVGNFQVCDAISVVNGQAAYTMQVGSTNVEPENANHMLVSLNGVLQKPGSSFTISGSTITFASNLATGDVIDFIILLGDVLNIGTPSDSGVTTASIAANAVTGAKLNTDVISAQTALGAEPADTDEFLVSDAGVLKRVDYSYIKGGGITHADGFRLSSSQNQGTDAVVSSGWERIDDASFGGIGTGLTESSGIFSFPSTGIYQISFIAEIQQDSSDSISWIEMHVTTDNSNYDEVTHVRMENPGERESFFGMFIVDVTDTSNVKFQMKTSSFKSGTTTALQGSTDSTYTGIFSVRLGDT